MVYLILKLQMSIQDYAQVFRFLNLIDGFMVYMNFKDAVRGPLVDRETHVKGFLNI